MQRWRKGLSVGCIVGLLFICFFMTVSAMTRLDKPVFTQVYYEQNNQSEHVLYFYMIHNIENKWGKPFRFCFPEQVTISSTLQPATEYDKYSVLMEQEKRKWHNGKRVFGRYRVELLELHFSIPDTILKNGSLHLTKGKVYFDRGYYLNLDLGDIIITAPNTAVEEYHGQGQQNAMTYISVGRFSERPYFSDFGQVWAYLRAK